MLTVSGFRPMPIVSNVRSCSDANVYQNNRKDLNFKSSDIIYKKYINKKIIERGVLNKYSDVLGEKFDTVFLKPATAFLRKHGVSIESENIKKLHLNEIGGTAKNASTATLVDKDGEAIHYLYGPFFNNIKIKDVTKNGAIVDLIRKLSDGELSMCQHGNPLKDVEVPSELKAVIKKISAAKEEVVTRVDAKFIDPDAKVENIQSIYKALMPEN